MSVLAIGLEDRAEDLSANVVVARVVIGHHPLRGGDDRDAQSIVHARQRLHRDVNAPPRLRHPRDLADDRLAVEILELDLELFVAARVLDRGIAADVALGLEDVEHALAQPRGRRRHFRLVAHLGVVDARDHVAERIDHAAASLPARLDQARDQALGAEIPQRDARQLVLAVIPAWPSRNLAAIADARGRRVARQLGKLERGRKPLFHRLGLVLHNRLQPRTPARIPLAQLPPPIVLLDRTLLSHQYLLAFRV